LGHKVQGVESPQLDARDEEDGYEYECDEEEYPGRFCVSSVVMGGVKDGSTNVVEGISMVIA
jgi:hypothetical protein